MLVTLSVCPFCDDGRVMLDAVPGVVLLGAGREGPCPHLVALYGELEVTGLQWIGGQDTGGSRYWAWVRDHLPLTYAREPGEAFAPSTRDLVDYLVSLGLGWPGTPVPPVPVRITGGTSLDRERERAGHGEFELEVTGGLARRCLLYHWSFYTRDPEGFTAAVPDLVRLGGRLP